MDKMNTSPTLEEALALALKLAPKERLQLIERVASSVEHDIEIAPSDEEPPEEHWGKALNRLMDEIGPIEMLYPEIEDPVEWVKHLRAEQRRRRLGDWGEQKHSGETESVLVLLIPQSFYITFATMALYGLGWIPILYDSQYYPSHGWRSWKVRVARRIKSSAKMF